MSEKAKTVALNVFAIAVGLGAIMLVSGVVYEQVERARDRGRFPQIGRSVDIGDNLLASAQN